MRVEISASMWEDPDAPVSLLPHSRCHSRLHQKPGWVVRTGAWAGPRYVQKLVHTSCNDPAETSPAMARDSEAVPRESPRWQSKNPG